jgi:hypothetical protein
LIRNDIDSAGTAATRTAAGGKSDEEADQDGAVRRRLPQQPGQRGRDENILFEDAGMHDEERRRRAGGRRRQGWPVGQHEPRQAERSEHQDWANEGRF